MYFRWYFFVFFMVPGKQCIFGGTFFEKCKCSRNFPFSAINHQQLGLGLGFFFLFFQSRFWVLGRIPESVRGKNLNWEKKKKKSNPNTNLNCWWLTAPKAKFLISKKSTTKYTLFSRYHEKYKKVPWEKCDPLHQ